MLTFVAIIHAFVALGLILFVLLQDPKSGAAGVFGGGTSNSLFGATGAATILTVITRWLAIIFAITCVSLVYLTTKRGTSLLDDYVAPMNNKAPVTTEAATAGGADTAPEAAAPENKPEPATETK